MFFTFSSVSCVSSVFSWRCLGSLVITSSFIPVVFPHRVTCLQLFSPVSKQTLCLLTPVHLANCNSGNQAKCRKGKDFFFFPKKGKKKIDPTTIHAQRSKGSSRKGDSTFRRIDKSGRSLILNLTDSAL